MRIGVFSLALLALALPCAAQGLSASNSDSAVDGGTVLDGALQRRLYQANYYLKQFEDEVKRQRGGQNQFWHYRTDALKRVKELNEEYPDLPEVKLLMERASEALEKSTGNYTKVKKSWTDYKVREGELRKQVWAEGEVAWTKALAGAGTNVLTRAFPAPDPDKVNLEDLRGTYVVLDEVRYPGDQFYGGTGEYVACGKPSTGYYFLSLGGREWVGPLEAVKRYRRMVDSGLDDVDVWTVLGRVVDVTAEIPVAGKEKLGRLEYGWVVEPVAVMVPGHVTAFYDPDATASGRFAGEEKVAALKESWYTVKTIPDDVEPSRLMEIFMTAIREKNFDLYCACINPDRQKTPTARSLLKYHWDLHQERFHNEYVHATFGPARISVAKGFDEGEEFNDYFLSAEKRAQISARKGEKTEEAIVESRAFDERGNQLGSPVRHQLLRKGGGRWYVNEYEQRF